MRLLCLVLALLSFQVGAQTWPAKPIRLIAPYPPGGQTDVVSRWLAEKLTPVLGQPVVVENRAGAQGAVGLQAAKTAAPDGYTFVYTNVSNLTIAPNLEVALPYDAQKDFAPVTQLGLTVLAMVVPATLGPKNLKEFIAWAKANPGKVSFASFGNGSTSHVYGEMLKGAAGLDMVHVPYKGAGPAVQDTLGGQVQMTIQDLASVSAHIASGRLVPMAVTGPKRWPLLPDLPTFIEQGYPLDIAGWNGIHAPAGTPRPVIERMNAEINKIIQSPEGREQMLKFGLLATGTTPEALGEVIRTDTPKWGAVIRKAGIKAQ
ncbi:MAG TPA: tripartite tricarboxylate transporter substrate binding protein [Burkholderiales bacterium]|jgi:tripartite-type tricarboxylate transporter receptor subunit TctC|nr:tripartite tricarboxylate transporter substrate binding protein [Burkholderiales bacterium]